MKKQPFSIEYIDHGDYYCIDYGNTGYLTKFVIPVSKLYKVNFDQDRLPDNDLLFDKIVDCIKNDLDFPTLLHIVNNHMKLVDGYMKSNENHFLKGMESKRKNVENLSFEELGPKGMLREIFDHMFMYENNFNDPEKMIEICRSLRIYDKDSLKNDDLLFTPIEKHYAVQGFIRGVVLSHVVGFHGENIFEKVAPETDDIPHGLECLKTYNSYADFMTNASMIHLRRDWFLNQTGDFEFYRLFRDNLETDIFEKICVELKLHATQETLDHYRDFKSHDMKRLPFIELDPSTGEPSLVVLKRQKGTNKFKRVEKQEYNPSFHTNSLTELSKDFVFSTMIFGRLLVERAKLIYRSEFSGVNNIQKFKIRPLINQRDGVSEKEAVKL